MLVTTRQDKYIDLAYRFLLPLVHSKFSSDKGLYVYVYVLDLVIFKYKITKMVRAFSLVKNLLFIVPVNS